MKLTLYPLTPAQQTHQNAAKEFGSSQILNLGICLTLQASLDFGLLKNCIQQEYKRYECLRVRFTEPDENGDIMQYITAHDSRDIPFEDLTGKTKEEIDSIMTDWSAVPFDKPHGPMNRFIMVSLPNGYQGIYVCIDHRLIDSTGIVFMVNDIMELYCHYLFKTPMPEPLGSYEEALIKDLERNADPKRAAKDIAFWNEQIAKGEPIYTDVTGSRKLEESRKNHNNPKLRAADRSLKDMSGARAIFQLEPEPSKRLMDFCLSNNISMTNLLLMGLRTYLSKANDNQTDVSLRNYVSRRATRLERTSGGNRIHYYPCRTVMEPDTEFLEGIRIISELQNNIYRHSNFDQQKVFSMFAEAYDQPPKTTYESVALTYQPMPMRLQNNNLVGVPYHTEWYANKAAAQKLYLTVMHSAGNLGLQFYFKYQTAELTEHDVELVYYYLMKIIFMGVENPEITIGEIIQTV